MDEVIRAVAGQILDSPHVADPVKGMLWLHLFKPWVPGFRAVLISPLRSGLEKHLAAHAGGWQGRTLYVPSAEFWMAHARSSHESGQGCDAGAHIAFLTAEGSSAEFLYFNLHADNSIHLLGPGDFEEECRYWESVFPVKEQRPTNRYGHGQYGGGY